MLESIWWKTLLYDFTNPMSMTNDAGVTQILSNNFADLFHFDQLTFKFNVHKFFKIILNFNAYLTYNFE